MKLHHFFHSCSCFLLRASQTAVDTLTMSSTAPAKVDLDSKSFRELQDLCREAKLSVKGNTAALKKRLRAENTKANKAKRAAPKTDNVTKNPPKKKAKSSPAAKPSPADDLICPITLELPVDPVMAEDGRTYERNAIMAYFRTKPGAGPLESPLTNASMGRRLVPTAQVKNFIATLIERGDIPEDMARVWKQKTREKQEVLELTRKAEGGNVPAMLCLADLHYSGKKVGTIDIETACHWYKKAADTGNMRGLVNAACLLAPSIEHSKNGLTLMGMAAQGGSTSACFHLGTWFAKGRHGLSVDKGQAIRLLQMGVGGTCTYKDATAAQIKDARAMLQKLKK